MISPVFWTHSGKFAFQAVGNYFRVYNHMGDWVKEFKTFGDMCEWLQTNDR